MCIATTEDRFCINHEGEHDVAATYFKIRPKTLEQKCLICENFASQERWLDGKEEGRQLSRLLFPRTKEELEEEERRHAREFDELHNAHFYKDPQKYKEALKRNLDLGNKYLFGGTHPNRPRDGGPYC